MRPRLGIFAGLQIADLLPGGAGNLQTFAYVLGAVVIVIALLLFIMVMAGKTPVLTFGRFRFEAPLSQDTAADPSPDSD